MANIAVPVGFVVGGSEDLLEMPCSICAAGTWTVDSKDLDAIGTTH